MTRRDRGGGRRPRDPRTRRMLPISALAPPPHGPVRLARAVRVARVREALGRDLGRHLVALHETERTITLLFEDDAWAKASRRQIGSLADALGPLMRGRRLVIESAADTPAASDVDDSTPDP